MLRENMEQQKLRELDLDGNDMYMTAVFRKAV